MTTETENLRITARRLCEWTAWNDFPKEGTEEFFALTQLIEDLAVAVAAFERKTTLTAPVKGLRCE